MRTRTEETYRLNSVRMATVDSTGLMTGMAAVSTAMKKTQMVAWAVVEEKGAAVSSQADEATDASETAVLAGATRAAT